MSGITLSAQHQLAGWQIINVDASFFDLELGDGYYGWTRSNWMSFIC